MGLLSAMEQEWTSAIMGKAVKGPADNKPSKNGAVHGVRARLVGGSRRSTPRRLLKRQQRRQNAQQLQPSSSEASTTDTRANSFEPADGQPVDILGMDTGVDYSKEEMQLDTPKKYNPRTRSRYSQQPNIRGYKGEGNAQSRQRGALNQPQRRSQNH